jgi:hypothetical protein
MAASPEDDYGRIVRLLMLTGQRRNEMGDMQHFPSEWCHPYMAGAPTPQ